MNTQGLILKYNLDSWEKMFNIYTDSAVMWCSAQSNTIQFNSIDRITILFLRLLLDKQKDGLLIYPFNKCNLLPVLAAEALYHRVPHKEKKKVLLIGERNICIRNAFQSLKNAADEPLEKYFSIGIIRPDGSVNNISKMRYNHNGKKRILEPLLLFSSSLDILPIKDTSDQIYSMIVEINSNTDNTFFKKINDFKKNKGLKSIFYITSDPHCEQTKSLLSSGIPYWSWNQNELIEDLKNDPIFSNLNEKYLKNNFSTPFYQLKNCFEGVQKFIVPVKEDKLNKMLLEAKSKFKILMKYSKEINSSRLKNASISYLKVIHSFEQLMAPLSLSEKEYSYAWGTTTIENKIQYLSSTAESLRNIDNTTASFFYNSIEDLKQIYTYLQKNQSGKPVIAVQIIEESIKNKKKIAIVLRNKASKVAFLNYLESAHSMDQQFLEINGISIDYSKNEDILKESELGIFYNPNYKLLNILHNSCCSKIILLAYISEIKSLEHLIEHEYNEVNSISSYDQKVISTSKILKNRNQNTEYTVKKPSNSTLKFKKPIIIQPQNAVISNFEYLHLSEELAQIDLSVDSEFEELDNFSEFFNQNSHSAMNPSSITDIRKYAYDKRIKAYLIKLEGNKGLFTAYDKSVSIYHNWDREVLNKKVKDIKSGDLLILINDGLKKTLVEQVVDTVERHPKMIEVVLYQKYWIESLRKNMILNKDTPASLFKKLKEKGSRIETHAAVYFWAAGEVIGPSKANKDNIKFLGEIYEDRYLVENYEKIYNSIDRLRRINIKLKRNLHKLMINAGLMLENGDEDQVIDEELGLYLEDFANSIAIKRVVSVEGPYDIDTGRTEKIFDV